MNITRIKIPALAVTGAVVLVTTLAACGPGNSSGQALENKDSQNVEKTYLLNEPPPHFGYSAIRATAIAVEAIQALNEQTTSFGFNQGVKNPVWTCPSLGEPVASTTQITNPDQTTSGGNSSGGNSSGGYAIASIGNMDPNGVYSGDSTGTYVLCVNASGTPYAQYWEGFVDTVSGPATWDAKTGQIVVSGQPTMPTCTVTKGGTKQAKTTCTK